VSPDDLEAIFGLPELPITEVTDDALLSFNKADVRAVGVLGGGGVATAATVALFYRALLHNPDGLCAPRVAPADATGRVRYTFPDPLLGVSANRALGVVVAGDDGNANRRGSGTPSRPVRSATTGLADRSPRPTPRAASPSATSPTAAT
jgi:hypothetical protein